MPDGRRQGRRVARRQYRRQRPHTAWIKTSKADGDLGSWNGTGDEMSTYDWEPQEALDNGAAVLREGLS